MSIADDIAEIFEDEDIVQMDGFDDCIIGYTEPLNETPQLCYSVDKILETLRTRDGMDYLEAQEWFDHNMQYGPCVLVFTP